jgi:hypothetical protein
MERSGRVRVHGKKVAAQGEFFEDPHGEIFALGGADEELPARGLEAVQHRMDAGVDGVLLPAGGGVTQAVVVQESGTARLVRIRHEAAHGVIGGRADEPVKRPGPGDAMGFKGVGKAPENAGFRVSERAVEIEYCRPAHHHVISIACGPGPGVPGLSEEGGEESRGEFGVGDRKIPLLGLTDGVNIASALNLLTFYL